MWERDGGTGGGDGGGGGNGQLDALTDGGLITIYSIYESFHEVRCAPAGLSPACSFIERKVYFHSVQFAFLTRPLGSMNYSP